MSNKNIDKVSIFLYLNTLCIQDDLRKIIKFIYLFIFRATFKSQENCINHLKYLKYLYKRIEIFVIVF